MKKIFPFAVCLLYSLYSYSQLSHRLDSLSFLKPGTGQPGFALAIEENGKIVYQKTAGLANISTGAAITAASCFRMASVSKQFTAMAILMLEKAKLLSLEDPIGRYLPELPEKTGSQILIRHLLSQTSGIWDYEDLIPMSQQKQVLDADVVEMLKSKDTTYFLPGSRFQYSNSGFCLLALIVERVSHQSFASFLKEHLFNPLKMTSSAVYESGIPVIERVMGYAKDSTGEVILSDQSVTSATKGDGGVYTSLHDYLIWIHALQQNKLLNLQEALQRIDFKIAEGKSDYYGAGWFQTGQRQRVLFHSGSTCGFNNYVIEVPARRLSIVYFSNLADNFEAFKAIVLVLKESGYGDFSHVLDLHKLTN